MLDYADRPIKLPIEWTAGASEMVKVMEVVEVMKVVEVVEVVGMMGMVEMIRIMRMVEMMTKWGSISRRLLSLANSFFALNRPVVLLLGTQFGIQPSSKQ